MRNHILFAAALTLTPACVVEEEATPAAGHIAAELRVAGASTPVLTVAVRIWENRNPTAALWPADAEGAVVVLYPAKRGWGAYLFATRTGEPPELVADYHGRPATLSLLIEDSFLEWSEREMPGADLGYGVLGSIKKKPPVPIGPPGTPDKAAQRQQAHDLVQGLTDDLASKPALRAEL